MNNHVMLDLETLGTWPGCAILSVGACTFDPRDNPDAPWLGRSFTANIDGASCQAAGLIVEPLTLAWWDDQPAAVREQAMADPQPLIKVINDFHYWWGRIGARYLWSNGAGFDEVLWRAACRAVRIREPWKYWNVRDTRTVWDIGGVDQREVARDGPLHTAYADARHQARCVQLAYRNLKKSWPGTMPTGQPEDDAPWVPKPEGDDRWV